MAKVRCAFIGAGDISHLHAQAVQSIPEAELVGIWSREACETVPAPASVALRFSCKLYTSAEQLVADPGVDAVFILTNMETHCHYAVLAMNAGKHVLVEKPVASSVEELQRMKEASIRNQVVLMPGHNYIYEPWFTRTRALIEEGKLGRITAIYILYNIHHPESVMRRGSMQGVVRQIMTHHSYMLLYLLGLPTEVSAFSAVVNDGSVHKENIAVASFKLAGGGLAHLEANFAADDHGSDPWSVYVKVLGSKGSARYSYNDWVVNQAAAVHSHTYVPYPETIRAEVRHFLGQCVQRGQPPLSTIDDAIRCQRMIEAIEHSIAHSKHVPLAKL